MSRKAANGIMSNKYRTIALANENHPPQNILCGGWRCATAERPDRKLVYPRRTACIIL